MSARESANINTDTRLQNKIRDGGGKPLFPTCQLLDLESFKIRHLKGQEGGLAPAACALYLIITWFCNLVLIPARPLNLKKFLIFRLTSLKAFA
jgi:hypothetical protein